MSIPNPKSKMVSVSHLSYQGIYPCPVCRLGQIEALPLMEAMACDFCRHIFTANPERQQLKLVSRQPPLIWRWNGRNWTAAHLEGVELGWGYWIAAAALVLLPPSLIGLTVYAFPPTPGTLSILVSIHLDWANLARAPRHCRVAVC